MQISVNSSLTYFNYSLSSSRLFLNDDNSRKTSLTLIKVVLGGVFSAFTILTIFGNLLVVIAVFRERYLRTITNFFIVSLAFADLTMGTIVMPFAVISYLCEEEWWFGEDWCDLWHAFDVLSSTASILNLCMIAVERYWATENPITYSRRVNKHRCLLLVGAVWICSSLISFPAIAWWRQSAAVNAQLMKDNDSNSTTTSNEPYLCLFTEDSVYLIVSAIISFYIPLIIMAIMYRKIYITASTLMKSINEGKKIVISHKEPQISTFRRLFTSKRQSQNSSKMNNGGTTKDKSSVLVMRIHRGGTSVISAAPEADSSNIPGRYSTVAMNNRTNDDQRRYSAISMVNPLKPSGSIYCRSLSHLKIKSNICINDNPQDSENTLSPKTNSLLPLRLRRSGFGVSQRFKRFAREQKAAKTLGIVMGIFICCWLPFFVCSPLNAIFKGIFSPNEGTIFLIVTWLGYINSSINPLIYAHSMRDFRRAFLRISQEICFCIGHCQQQSRGEAGKGRVSRYTNHAPSLCYSRGPNDVERLENMSYNFSNNASWANINNSTAGLSCSLANGGAHSPHLVSHMSNQIKTTHSWPSSSSGGGAQGTFVMTTSLMRTDITSEDVS